MAAAALRFAAWKNGPLGGVPIGVLFAAMALATWLLSFSSNPEKWHAALTGEQRGSR